MEDCAFPLNVSLVVSLKWKPFAQFSALNSGLEAEGNVPASLVRSGACPNMLFDRKDVAALKLLSVTRVFGRSRKSWVTTRGQSV